MPPFLADDCCRPYLYDPSLTDAEIATVTKWIEDGSPEGPPLTPAPVPPEGGLSRTDLVLAMPEPYTPEPRPGEQDVVRCFLLDWPRADRSFVTGFDPMPGNRSVVHHLIVAAVEPDAVPRYEAADRADPGPGFECAGAFGSLGGYHLLGGSLLGSDFPDGVGREVAPGSKIVLHIHYAIPEFGPPPEPDLTRVALRLDPVARPLEPACADWRAACAARECLSTHALLLISLRAAGDSQERRDRVSHRDWELGFRLGTTLLVPRPRRARA